MSVATRAASKISEWSKSIPQALEDVVRDYNLPETADWQPLDELSSQTRFEQIDVDADASVFDGSNFIAPATVYVKLIYEPNSKDPTVFDDSYPARVFYNIEDESVVLIKVEVDTTSFYE